MFCFDFIKLNIELDESANLYLKDTTTVIISDLKDLLVLHLLNEEASFQQSLATNLGPLKINITFFQSQRFLVLGPSTLTPTVTTIAQHSDSDERFMV